jgi:hypothetical protein
VRCRSCSPLAQSGSSLEDRVTGRGLTWRDADQRVPGTLTATPRCSPPGAARSGTRRGHAWRSPALAGRRRPPGGPNGLVGAHVVGGAAWGGSCHGASGQDP